MSENEMFAVAFLAAIQFGAVVGLIITARDLRNRTEQAERRIAVLVRHAARSVRFTYTDKPAVDIEVIRDADD